MIRRAIFLFCCIVFANAVAAQQATFRDPLLDHLVGHWVLTGTIDGKPVTHDVSAAWVLNHQYLLFRETDRKKNKDGEPAYDSAVYIGWDEPTHQYACAFMDTFGDLSTQSIGRAPRNRDSIALVFQDLSDSGTFHNTLSYRHADDSWTMNMDQGSAGNLTPFARTVLTREK